MTVPMGQVNFLDFHSQVNDSWIKFLQWYMMCKYLTMVGHVSPKNKLVAGTTQFDLPLQNVATKSV
jgi:hypothetical protein